MTRSWINDYTDDKGFELVPVSGNGDCFFTAVQKAFEYKGSNVSVSKLRQFVANQMTQDIYNVYYTVYTDANKERDSEMMMRMMFMQGVGDLETLKRVVLTSRFWANETAISILEKGLQIKFILFSEQRYTSHEFPCVLSAEVIDDELDPNWYIFLNYTGAHYDLVTYHGMSRLKPEQVPTCVRMDLLHNVPLYGKKIRGFDQEQESLEEESVDDTVYPTSQDCE